jgi:bacterioferritin
MTKIKSAKNKDIIRELCVAYAMELETVQNYIANSVNLDGVRSDVIKKALAADVPTELQHAQQLAQRIKTIGGRVPGSLDNPRDQAYLQPPKDTTDVVAVIKGVIRAEEGAIAQYNKIIRLCDGRDYVTQDMVIGILSGEEDHRREFMGFLREYAR